MKLKPLKITETIVVFLFFSILTSCALRPLTSEYNGVEVKKGIAELSALGNGKILIYNGADILHKIDNTARLNIWIDDKALGQIRQKEYINLDLEDGEYSFKLLHIDIFKMRSKHDVEINTKTKVIRVEPTLASNKLTITNEFPDKFQKFEYAKHIGVEQ